MQIACCFRTAISQFENKKRESTIMLSYIARVLLFMFALPALGLITFTGGIWTGLGAALLVGIVGAVLSLALLPAIAGVGIVGSLLSGAIGGRLGLILFWCFLGAVLEGLAIAGVAWLLPGIALIGFWQTVGAGAILGAVTGLLSPSKQS